MFSKQNSCEKEMPPWILTDKSFGRAGMISYNFTLYGDVQRKLKQFSGT